MLAIRHLALYTRASTIPLLLGMEVISSTENALHGQTCMASTDSAPTLATQLSPVPVGLEKGSEGSYKIAESIPPVLCSDNSQGDDIVCLPGGMTWFLFVMLP